MIGPSRTMAPRFDWSLGMRFDTLIKVAVGVLTVKQGNL